MCTGSEGAQKGENCEINDGKASARRTVLTVNSQQLVKFLIYDGPRKIINTSDKARQRGRPGETETGKKLLPL